ncbi:MAG: MBL fold metallo-hydrolase [Patescibacteria group bacterium]|jgi:competence protein ComEC
MNPSPVTKKTIFLSFTAAIYICLLIFLNNVFDERTKIVFCNVGQGDAAYIRIKNRVDVLIDAGPDVRILSCLGKHMPFWDKKIELIFISHNQNDHFGGMNYLLDRYQIGYLYLVDDLNASLQSFKRLKQKIIGKKIRIKNSSTGQQIVLLDDIFSLLWPSKNFISNNDNDYSQVLLFQENNFRVLFTGDASPFILGRLSHGSIEKVDILKVPHHGSKNGLTKTFLDLADPNIAVISLDKNNSYGHPHRQVLDMIKAKNIKILRTDNDGDIVLRIKRL